VDHTHGEYVRGIVHVNFSESYFSLLKRGIIGAFHYVSAQHMQRYLEEFDFRWNRRKMNDFERLVEAVAGTEGTRLYYRAPSFWRGRSRAEDALFPAAAKEPEESEEG
jgi:hypothetical protein